MSSRSEITTAPRQAAPTPRSRHSKTGNPARAEDCLCFSNKPLSNCRWASLTSSTPSIDRSIAINRYLNFVSGSSEPWAILNGSATSLGRFLASASCLSTFTVGRTKTIGSMYISHRTLTFSFFAGVQSQNPSHSVCIQRFFSRTRHHYHHAHRRAAHARH